MDLKTIRAARLQELVDAEPPPDRGKKTRFAARIGRSPSQLAQWLSGIRTIEETSARHIEQRCRKPLHWLDGIEQNPTVLYAQEPERPYLVNHWPFINITAADLQELSPEQRAELEGYVRGLLAANRRLSQATPQHDPPLTT